MKEEKRLEKGGNGLERRRRAGMEEKGGNWEKDRGGEKGRGRRRRDGESKKFQNQKKDRDKR